MTSKRTCVMSEFGSKSYILNKKVRLDTGVISGHYLYIREYGWKNSRYIVRCIVRARIYLIPYLKERKSYMYLPVPSSRSSYTHHTNCSTLTTTQVFPLSGQFLSLQMNSPSNALYPFHLWKLVFTTFSSAAAFLCVTSAKPHNGIFTGTENVIGGAISRI